MRLKELISESAPKGWEGTVKAMKKHKDIDNPWALAHYMKNKGYKSHKKEGMEEDHEIQMADSELKSIYHNSRKLLKLIQHYSEQEGLEAWQQSKITKAADYLNSVLQAVSGQQTR